MAQYQVTDTVTGETFMVDESEVGKYMNQPISSTAENPMMGGMASGVTGNLNQLLLMLAMQNLDPDNASTYSTLASLAENIQKANEPSESDQADINLERRLGLLESLWFPHEDKLALPEPTNKAGRFAHKLQKQFEGSSEYELFRRQARTLGATLAKAAGDTGNIAWAEQAAQLQALADADLTKEEAEASFRNIRIGLGLEEKDDKYYNALRKGQSSTPTNEITTTTTASATEPPEGMGGITDFIIEDMPEEGTILPDDPSRPGYKPGQTLPNLPYSELSALIGRFLPAPPGLRAGATSLFGSGLDTLKDIGNPEKLQEMGYDIDPQTGNVVGGNLGDITKYAIGNTGNAIKEAGVAALLDMIFSPVKTVGTVRDAVAQRAGNVSTEPVAQAAVNYAQNAPATIRNSVSRRALDAIEKFSGQKISVPEALKQATASQDIAYVGRDGAATVGRTASSKLEEVIANALRDQIAQKSPVTGYLTTALNKILEVQNSLGRVGSFGAKTAGNIGTFYALSKLLPGFSGGGGQ